MSSTEIKTEQTKPKNALSNKKNFRLSDAAFFAWIAAILAVFVLYVVYLLQMQTVAGGSYTVMRMDLYHQYGPLYAELYDRLTTGESLIYSWNTGLGSSFLGNFFNYCCSPFTLLILLFGHYNIPESIAIIILLKGAAAAFSFTYFANRIYGTRKASIAFGLLYAFSGYFVAYSWNVMWLDAFLIFPIVMMGIAFIIRQGKPTVYIAALTYTMITNYYMAYMVCILSVVYFLYYYFSYYKFSSRLKEPSDDEQLQEGYFGELKNSRFMMAGFKFALSSILAFLMSAFALLPVFFILTGSSATSSSGWPAFSEWKEYFNIFDFLANHLANLEPTIRSSGDDVLPNIYCGVMTLFLVPAFLFSKNISKKRKALTCCLLAFFYASFALNFLNYIWHGMHYPNDLPYRYSFAYSFILLSLAYEAFLHIREYSERFFIATGVSILGFIVLLQELGSKNIAEYTLMVNIAFVVIFAAILGLFAIGKFKKDTVSMILVCVVICELSVANVGHYVMSQPKDSYAGDYYDFQDITYIADEYELKNDNDLFYREERSKLLTRMDASWLDYNGISIFSSMAYETTSKLHRQFGLFSNGINSYTYNPQTAIYNSMFSLKYIYDKNDLLQEGFMYSYVDSNETFDIYKYNYFLPLAFSVDDDMSTWADYGGTDPFVNQNRFFELATGITDVLENVTPDTTISTTGGLTASADSITNGSFRFDAGSSEGTATVTYIADKAGEYCIYFKSPSCLGFNITADNGIQNSTRYSSGSTQYFSMNVGYLEEGQTAKVVLTYPADTKGTANIYAVRLNEEKFLEGYNKIQNNGTLDITTFEETYIQGTVNITNENALLYTSIPYDKSWKIKVDGIEVNQEDITPIADALLAIRIDKGEHNIEFKYEPQGLKIGILLSVIGYAIAIILIALSFHFKRKKASDKPVPSFFLPADDTDMHTFEDTSTDDNTTSTKQLKQKSILWQIVLCYLTCGIYYYVWKYSLSKKINQFEKEYFGRNGMNPILVTFVPLMAAFWIADKSGKLKKKAKEYGIEIKSSEIWRFLLTLIGGGGFALGELEDDLNFFTQHIAEARTRNEEGPISTDTEQAAAESECNSDKPLTIEETSETDDTAEQKNEVIYFSKNSDFVAKVISIGVVFFFLMTSILGFLLLVDKAQQHNDELSETTAVSTTQTSTLITVPSSTESTTVTTTETTTEPETTTVLNNEVVADAARTLLRFTGVELNNENGVIVLVGVTAKEGDTVAELCERHGVDGDAFTSMIVLLNNLSSEYQTFSEGELVILPMLAGEEPSTTDTSAVG